MRASLNPSTSPAVPGSPGASSSSSGSSSGPVYRRVRSPDGHTRACARSGIIANGRVTRRGRRREREGAHAVQPACRFAQGDRAASATFRSGSALGGQRDRHATPGVTPRAAADPRPVRRHARRTRREAPAGHRIEPRRGDVPRDARARERRHTTPSTPGLRTRWPWPSGPASASSPPPKSSIAPAWSPRRKSTRSSRSFASSSIRWTSISRKNTARARAPRTRHQSSSRSPQLAESVGQL